MQEDQTAVQKKLANFFLTMSTVQVQALLLDYDGTLAPFRTDPATAIPYPGVREVLERIKGCERSKLILVSGRRAGEVRQLLGVDHVEVWGCHGMERLSSTGVLQTNRLDSRTAKALASVRGGLVYHGVAGFIEDKPTGHAVHWRGLSADRADSIRVASEAVWSEIADKEVLRILHFDGGIEICASAMNKGDVVRLIAAGLGDSYAMAYLGDDVTDEDAFLALKGIGLSVLVREAERDTNADVWIRPPDDVLKFLERWGQACQNHA